MSLVLGEVMRATSRPELQQTLAAMSTSLTDRIRLRLSRTVIYLRARDLVLGSGRDTYWVVREDLARRYLHGDGIEIGALTAPLRTHPASLSVTSTASVVTN